MLDESMDECSRYIDRIRNSTKFAVLGLKIYSMDHKEILHTSRQLHYRGMQKFSLFQLSIL